MSIDQHKLQHTVAYLILFKIFSLLFLDRAFYSVAPWWIGIIYHVSPRVVMPWTKLLFEAQEGPERWLTSVHIRSESSNSSIHNSFSGGTLHSFRFLSALFRHQGHGRIRSHLAWAFAVAFEFHVEFWRMDRAVLLCFCGVLRCMSSELRSWLHHNLIPRMVRIG